MTAATMTMNTSFEEDLVLPGPGFDAFLDFLYKTPSQPQLLDMTRGDIINASKRILSTPPVSPTSSRSGSVASSRSNINRNDWDTNYKALKAYHALHGNCSVPFGKETGSLRSWTERQKKLHASSMLEPEMVDDLKALDFDFTVKVKGLSTRSINSTKPLSTRSMNTKNTSKPSGPVKSASMVERTTPPTTAMNNTEKENNSSSKAPPLPSQPKKGVSFSTNAKAPMVRKSSLVIDDETTWTMQYEELKAYQAEHGNCDIPFGKETGSLRSWTERQKRLHASSRLDAERTEKMTELGFSF
mmetsp:Transcript_13035/g.24904  ORF Transcript_13035/g.24904 Transcript_13035/m.24904 type:complete len:300 (-) Transcript_13035:982-1881(-)|eukprot:CAMPEP_0201667524 /NCGR_PEP_ID=MMETSP0494-20130426/15423_1 /ASSEMBLY_ACC=CAM_ASM_000839 /TAXON_ID=420259 /ORGANISM="Thalassiosira gravida, Strain GMp14c1" /LENGTH=299 /DNA_ID=CAMNT_0048147541 /DNA_START=135 /DNA_END=1034 /DNA_ORIENTATION=+